MAKHLLLFIALACFIAAGLLWYTASKTDKINSFDECVAAGYLALESTSPKCTTPSGKTFTANESWRTDGIFLYITEENRYACTGCSAELCVDIPGPINSVDETVDLHCTENFSVINTNNISPP
jgi:hypothetical protein